MSKKCLVVLAVLIVPMFAGAAPLWTAYNDLAWTNTQATYGGETHYATSTDQDGLPSNGELKNWSDGVGVGVNVAVSGGGYVVSHGAMPNAGTDAYNAFNGKIDGVGEMDYNAVENGQLLFTGMDTSGAITYELTIFGCRNNATYGQPATARVTDFIISDVDAFANNSSVGADFSGVGDNSTVITNGYNTLDGFVAKFTGIVPGEDGDMLITVADGGSVTSAGFYANGFMLEAIPEPSTMALFGLGGLLLFLRRRKK
ncbi:MAG: PEP-CTERM sorting domain-containing protein [Kiritimatiellae bacterium]|nr:PEP-CTERM sorting domain-containing protein [Kiritimatiellia bacterium]